MTDLERLIDHCCYLGLDVRDYADNADRSTESFVSLPDHLQEMINAREEQLDECEHGQGVTDYCEPCGRINAG